MTREQLEHVIRAAASISAEQSIVSIDAIEALGTELELVLRERLLQGLSVVRSVRDGSSG